MNDLPPDIDLSFLVGATLIQVCVGDTEVILNLYPEAEVTAASTVRIGGGRGPGVVFESSKLAGLALLDLLGDSVSAASGAADGTLTLQWSSGRRVEICDTFSGVREGTFRFVPRSENNFDIEDRVALGIDPGGAITLKAVEPMWVPDGDPVELTATEARGLADALVRFAEIDDRE